jgi:hypothetical protein
MPNLAHSYCNPIITGQAVPHTSNKHSCRLLTCPDPGPAVVEAKGVQPLLPKSEAPGIAWRLGCPALS